MQSVYSIASADWAILEFKFQFWKQKNNNNKKKKQKQANLEGFRSSESRGCYTKTERAIPNSFFQIGSDSYRHRTIIYC